MPLSRFVALSSFMATFLLVSATPGQAGTLKSSMSWKSADAGTLEVRGAVKGKVACRGNRTVVLKRDGIKTGTLRSTGAGKLTGEVEPGTTSASLKPRALSRGRRCAGDRNDIRLTLAPVELGLGMTLGGYALDTSLDLTHAGAAGCAGGREADLFAPAGAGKIAIAAESPAPVISQSPAAAFDPGTYRVELPAITLSNQVKPDGGLRSRGCARAESNEISITDVASTTAITDTSAGVSGTVGSPDPACVAGRQVGVATTSSGFVFLGTATVDAGGNWHVDADPAPDYLAVTGLVVVPGPDQGSFLQCTESFVTG